MSNPEHTRPHQSTLNGSQLGTKRECLPALCSRDAVLHDGPHLARTIWLEAAR
jgi:hypothetical protein